jgi:hypothetical protein
MIDCRFVLDTNMTVSEPMFERSTSTIRALVCDDEVLSMSPAELRFREACQYYVLFKNHYGPEVGQKEQRFLWTCFADAFLMAVVSLKDLTDKRSQLNAIDEFRLMTVMRNVTVHKIVAASPSTTGMVSRDISVSLGSRDPMTRDYEEPVLAANKLADSLANYQSELDTRLLQREKKNIEAALRWNAKLASQANPRILLADLFFQILQIVSRVCGFTMPSCM